MGRLHLNTKWIPGYGAYRPYLKFCCLKPLQVPLLQLLKNLQVIRLIINQYATGEQYATVKANVALVLTKLQKHHIIIEYRGGVNGELRNFEERFESSSAVIPGD